MTPARALITWLTGSGVTLRLDGDAIVHRGPRRVLSPDVLAKLREHKAEAIAELTRLADAGPPCPADIAERAAIIAERAAIIAEGDHCDRTTADTRALAEHGFTSWPALAGAHRESILGKLASLPPATSEPGPRLLKLTRAFLDSPHWRAAVALGWDRVELFGIHAHAPLRRPDAEGLVTGLALSRQNGACLQTITESHAVVRYRSGPVLTYRRFTPAMDAAVPWWECSALVGGQP
jgi:hypothetical protein